MIAANISKSGTPIAGKIAVFNCTVTNTVDGLINSPIATWILPYNELDSSISISNIEPSTSVLTFNPLKTSHGGTYVCNGSLISSASNQPLTVSMPEQVIVQSKLYSYSFSNYKKINGNCIF